MVGGLETSTMYKRVHSSLRNGDILRQEGARHFDGSRMSPEDAQQLDLEEPVI